MSAYFSLFRVPNLLILLLMQVLVRISIIEPVLRMNNTALHTGRFDFILLVISTLLIAAAGYAINDYFDVRIDRINKPGKNVLLNKLPLRRAIVLHTVFNVAGILLAFYCAYRVGSLKLGFIHVVATLVLWFYSLKYKRNLISGNVAISLLAALSVALVWLYEFFALQSDPLVFARLIGHFGKINIYVFGYAAFAFLVTLIREIVKDVEDMEGDRAYRCRTIPLVWGVKTAKWILAILVLLLLTALGLVIFRFYLWDFRFAFWYVLIAVFPLFLLFLFRLFQASEKEDFHKLGNLLKIAMIAGILSMQTIFFNF